MTIKTTVMGVYRNTAIPIETNDSGQVCVCSEQANNRPVIDTSGGFDGVLLLGIYRNIPTPLLVNTDGELII